MNDLWLLVMLGSIGLLISANVTLHNGLDYEIKLRTLANSPTEHLQRLFRQNESQIAAELTERLKVANQLQKRSTTVYQFAIRLTLGAIVISM